MQWLSHPPKFCMYVCMYACMHACMYVCMYACMHACMHACMYVCICICCVNDVCMSCVHNVPTRTQAPHVCMHACMHACMYLCLYMRLLYANDDCMPSMHNLPHVHRHPHMPASNAFANTKSHLHCTPPPPGNFGWRVSAPRAAALLGRAFLRSC